MTAFHAESDRVRHEIIDRNLVMAHAMLKDPSLEAVLAARSLDLIGILDSLYIPNSRDGVLVPPKQHDTSSSIPVYALYPGETVVKDASINVMHERQQDNLVKFVHNLAPEVSSDFITEFANKTLVRSNGETKTEIAPNNNAVVTRSGADIIIETPALHPARRTVHVSGKPLITFATHMPHSGEYNGLVVLHELIHVEQSLGETEFIVDYENKAVDDELEAYHFEAVAANALYTHSADRRFKNNQELRTSPAHWVESVRALNRHPTDPFRMTRAIRQLLPLVGINL